MTVPSSLQGVTCISPKSCTAVGWQRPQDIADALVESWDGVSWSLVPSAELPAGRGGWLQSIACISAQSCFAVGLLATHDAIDGNLTLVERWDGRSWTILSSPSPSAPGAELNSLASVVCVHGMCTAVGFYDVGDVYNSHERGLIESWGGHEWSIVPSGDAHALDTALSSIACDSAVSCVAVGVTNKGSPQARTFVEAWDGAAWSTRSQSAVAGMLEAVACPRSGSCVAVGEQSTRANPAGRAFIQWVR
jgi:hypothetical protein